MLHVVITHDEQIMFMQGQPQSTNLDAYPVGTPLHYEVRLYSLEACSFGQVLRAVRIRAAHCLTSIQFSPTSQLLLLSYGR